MEKWKNWEIDFLKNNYPEKGKSWCSESLNKTEGQIRSKASELKLRLNKESYFFKEFQERAAKSKVGKKRPEHSLLMKEYAENGVLPILTHKRTDKEKNDQSLRMKKYIDQNGHPKGMLGKTHKKITKEKMGNISRNRWSNPEYILNGEEYKQTVSDRQTKHMVNRIKENPESQYIRSKKGWIEIGNKRFFAKSSWEANMASYFQFLKDNNEIIDWDYEPKTFWFMQIKRGVRSYTPDFLITDKSGKQYYEEVKGYLDPKSKTKINRMRIYYPNIDLRLLDKKRYESISSKKAMIKNWGQLD